VPYLLLPGSAPRNERPLTHARHGRTTYSGYIISAAWHVKCQKVLQSRGGQCEACKSGENNNVYHTTFARLGHEKDDDLVVLCDKCHTIAQAWADSKPRLSLLRATWAVIEAVRLAGHQGAWAKLTGGNPGLGVPKWRPQSEKLKQRANRGLVVRQMTPGELSIARRGISLQRTKDAGL